MCHTWYLKFFRHWVKLSFSRIIDAAASQRPHGQRIRRPGVGPRRQSSGGYVVHFPVRQRHLGSTDGHRRWKCRQRGGDAGRRRGDSEFGGGSPTPDARSSDVHSGRQ
ncbi:unnamed protein product, partial [Nesidiocoris tenuis]